MTPDSLPVDSEALRANIAGTATIPQIPEKFQALVDAVADHYGPRELVRATLQEHFHPLRHAGTVIDNLQTILLRDWVYLDAHPDRLALCNLLLDVICELFDSSLTEEQSSQLLRQLLLWYTSLLSSRHASEYVLIGPRITQTLWRLLPRIPVAFLERDKPLRDLTRTGLEVAARFEDSGSTELSCAATTTGKAMVALYREVLRRGYETVLQHLSVAEWARLPETRLRESEAVAELFAATSKEHIQQLAELAENSPPEQLVSPEQPAFSEILDDIVECALKVRHPEDRFAVCLYLLKDNTLGLRQREVMVELLAVVKKLTDPTRRVHFHRILRRLARFFHDRERLYPEMRFQCYEAIGIAIGEAGAAGAADRLTDDLLSWPFEYPDVRGATDEWRTVVNPYHLPNIRCWLNIIRSNPRLYERLAAALAVQLRLGGAFIADTDLFQRDITALLNSDIRPIYSVVKQILRAFPVYFNELGAEGELRSASTEIDEICNRRDTLIHFLRKQVHAESSTRLIDFARAVEQYWKTLDPSGLASFVSPATLAAVEQERDLAEGPHRAITGLPAEPEDFRRVALLRRLIELLEAKYSTKPIGLANHVKAVAGISPEIREAFLSALEAWEAGFRAPQRGIMATVYRYSRARARETLLDASLSLLEALKDVILDPTPSEGQENIFHKRHVAAGIPSMYGTYRERKFDALGLSFRVETLVNKLLEDVAAEITDQYVSRASLRRFAANLDRFIRALGVEGIQSQNLQSDVRLLREGARQRVFSYPQCRNVFEFLANGVSSLVRFTIQPYDSALQAILASDRRPCQERGLDPDALAEAVLRELLVSTVGLQSLDRYVSNALLHLKALGERVSERDLTRMMNYDPDRLVAWLDVPDPDLDNQMTLGYKALGLKEMVSFGYKVPEGFVLTTELFSVFPAMSHRPLYEHTIARIRHAIARLEERTGLRLGDPERPLTLSIRSGAAISMPGLMLTMIDVGLNDELAEQIAARRPDMAWTAWDSYRRFLQSWAMSAGLDRDFFDSIMADFKQRCGVQQKLDFSPEQMREIALAYKVQAQEQGVVFIQDPFLQVIAAVGKVIDSWYSPQARFYRRYFGISDHWGTAVIIQRMVLGNLSRESGAGVTFTRSLSEKHGRQVRLFGDFAVGAQGEDLVGGLVFPLPITEAQRRGSQAYKGVKFSLESRFPAIYQRLLSVAEDLVANHVYDPQEIEFTFESPDPEDLYILQRRSMVEESGEPVPEFLPNPDGSLPRPDAVGIGVSGGALCGRAAITAKHIDELQASDSETNVILIRPDTVPEEIAMIVQAQGLLTARGGATSHAAVTAKRLQKTAVVDCRDLEVNESQGVAFLAGKLVRAGDWMSIDGRTGQIFLGKREVAYRTQTGHSQTPGGPRGTDL